MQDTALSTIQPTLWWAVTPADADTGADMVLHRASTRVLASTLPEGQVSIPFPDQARSVCVDLWGTFPYMSFSRSWGSGVLRVDGPQPGVYSFELGGTGVRSLPQAKAYLRRLGFNPLAERPVVAGQCWEVLVEPLAREG